MAQETPGRTYRVSDENHSKFMAFAKEMNISADSAIKMLIDTYELDQAKMAMPDRETEIANFQTKANELISAFIYSLQINQDAEARIRQDIAVEMSTKDQTIADYQAQVVAKLDEICDLKAQNKELEATATEVADLRIEMAKMEQELADEAASFEKQLKDKDSIVSMLTEKLTEAENKADGYEELMKERDSLSSMLKDSGVAMKELRKDHALELERAKLAAEKAKSEAVADVKAKADETIADLQKQLQQAQVNAAREMRQTEKDCAAKLEAKDENMRQYIEEIRKLEAEKATLKEQLANRKEQA